MVLFSLPILSVRFCAICRPQGLCGMLCVLFFCVLCERKKGPPREKERSSVKNIILTMWTGNVKIFRRLFPSLFREKAEYATRGGSSTFKNMPFLRQEGRLLRARRAYTRMQNVTCWFLVGYIFCYRWCYLRVVSVANLVDCKDFLSPCWLVSDREIVCEVAPIGLLAWGAGVFSLTLGNFISHRAHRFNRAFLRTVSSPQNAFGIQRTQSVTANEDTNKGGKSSHTSSP